MDDAEIERLFPFQVVLPAAMYSGHNFRLAIAYCGPSLAPPPLPCDFSAIDSD